METCDKCKYWKRDNSSAIPSKVGACFANPQIIDRRAESPICRFLCLKSAEEEK